MNCNLWIVRVSPRCLRCGNKRCGARKYTPSMQTYGCPGAVFPFFVNANNVGGITPPFLKFSVITPATIVMGTEARASSVGYACEAFPFPGRAKSPRGNLHAASSKQHRGPYRLGKREHRFTRRDAGTDLSHHVEYAVWGGSLVNALFVAPDVRGIFEYPGF
jgi:hypothetical protein